MFPLAGGLEPGGGRCNGETPSLKGQGFKSRSKPPIQTIKELDLWALCSVVGTDHGSLGSLYRRLARSNS